MCWKRDPSTNNPNRKIFCVESPSSRGSCADSGSCLCLNKGINKKIVSIKPFPMKKSGFAGGGAASPGGKKSNKSPVVAAGAAISVSHTDRETIVHTHSSNFREVVHQLTGASGEDTDLLPITVPSRLPASRGGISNNSDGDDVNGCINKHETVVKTEFAGRVPDLGPRKPTTTKLFERRRSSKTLERLSTSCRDLPPLVPSPVTPLASDFEKICLPVTPTASPSSLKMMSPQEHNALQIHATFNQQQTVSVQMYPTFKQPATHMYPTTNQPQTSAVQMYSAMSQPQNTVVQTDAAMSHNQATVEDLAIAEKGFYLHSQRPRNSDLTLLPLFPESPREQ